MGEAVAGVGPQASNNVACHRVEYASREQQ